MMNHEVKEEAHPPNSNTQEPPEKGFFVTQRITWVWTHPQLFHRTKKLQANQHGCSRQNWDQPGWVGGNTMAMGPLESRGPRLVQSTGTGALCPGGLPATQHQRCWVNSIDSSSHNLNRVSLLAEKRKWWFHLSYISLFLIWSNEWSQHIKSLFLRQCFLILQNTICSIWGGWERGRKPNQMEYFSFRILSAYAIDWSVG